MARSIFLAACLLALSSSPHAGAQTLAFDVASVRENRQANTDGETNVPLGPGNVYSPTAGRFSTRNFPLLTYINFAYRLSDAQIEAFRAKAPDWVSSTRFNIEARTDKLDVSKDQLRQMMRTLLADRFHLAVHYDTQQEPVYNLLLAKVGATGPKFVPHPSGADCPSTLPPSSSTHPTSETISGGFPTTCGGIILLPPEKAGNITIGGRNIALPLLAESLAGWGELGRPVVDATNLTSTYDFVLTYLPLRSDGLPSDAIGPTFEQALRQQLGLHLESAKSPVQILILDHIEPVTQN